MDLSEAETIPEGDSALILWVIEKLNKFVKNGVVL